MERQGRQKMTLNGWCSIAFILCWTVGATPAVQAFDPALAKQLTAEDSDVKLGAINQIAASGDAAAIPLLKAMQDDALQLFNGRLVIVAGSSVKDALSGESIVAPPEKLEAIVVNNRVRECSTAPSRR